MEPDALATLYPKRPVLRRGLPIIPQEYIVVGEVYMDYSFLEVGQQYLLTSAAGDIQVRVNVLKNTRSDRMSRPIVLFGAVDADSLEELATITDIFQVTQIGTNILGEIHPGPSNGRGSSEGYPNAYGHTRPVLPVSLSPQFALFRQELTTAHRPNRLPHLVSYEAVECEPVKVAILDTGLCYFSSHGVVRTGWNFVANTADVTDDHPSLHGTRIAAIIQEQAPEAHIIPIKTAFETGVCELYDILCGLEYARINRANVVNASFSFSSDEAPDLAIPLLHNLISVLENEDIWIVAAAGNATQYAHDSAGRTPPLGVGPYLYPACYSRADEYDRVLTVTTVSKRRPSATAGSVITFGLDECYSPTYVDVGVIANSQPLDTLFVNDKSFDAPGFVDDQPGTSYATAYMSGLVASALATRPVDRKTQLIDSCDPLQLPELAFGIRTQKSLLASREVVAS